MCGPLWATSNFAFERKNGSIRRKVNGTTDVVKQIATKIGFETYRHLNKKESLEENKKVKFQGGKKACTELEKTTLLELLSKKNIVMDSNSNFSLLSTITINNVMFNPSNYERSKKKFDSLVLLKNGSVGILEKIYKNRENQGKWNSSSQREKSRKN